MKYDARKLSTEEKALLRRIAVQRVFDGESAASVGRSYGLGDRTIYRWLREVRQNGFEALEPKPRPGRKKALSELEEQEVKRWILSGDPRQQDFDFALWTRQIVADLIESRLGVSLSLSAVGNLLKRQGLTPQRPVRRAYERDDEEVQKWIKGTYPAIKKQAKKQGAEIYWLDEASIRSDDPLMRTWGLKGQTPVVQTSGKRQGISALSALSNTGGFWYHVYSGKFNADVFIECLKEFMKGRQKPVFIIMDGHPVHKSKKVNSYIASTKGKLKIFLLPPYSPDLNPDELVWNYIRQTGTARTPLKKGESLLERTIIDLELIRIDKKLVKSFFQEAHVSFAAA